MSVWQIIGEIIKAAAKTAAKGATKLVKGAVKQATSQPLGLLKQGKTFVSTVKDKGIVEATKQLAKEGVKGIAKQVSQPLKSAYEMGKSGLEGDLGGVVKNTGELVKSTNPNIGTPSDKGSTGADTNKNPNTDSSLWRMIGNALNTNNPSGNINTKLGGTMGPQESDLPMTSSQLPIQSSSQQMIQQNQVRQVTDALQSSGSQSQPLAIQAQQQPVAQPLANQSQQSIPLSMRKTYNAGYLY